MAEHIGPQQENAMAAISDAQAITILREARDKSFDTAAKDEVAGLSTLLGAKTAQAEATKDQAGGKMLDSLTKYSASSAGMLLNLKTSQMANKPVNIRQMKDEADAAFASRKLAADNRRAGLNSISQQGLPGQLVDKAHDAMSQSVGGQSEVNKADIADKAAQLAEMQAKTVLDGAKDAKQQADKGIDSANEFTKGLYDRAKQVADKLFGG